MHHHVVLAHELAHQHGVENRSLHQAELGVAGEMGHVRQRTGGEVVEGGDPSPGRQQPLGQV